MLEKRLHLYLKLLCLCAVITLISGGVITQFFDAEPCVLCAIQRDIWLLIFLWSAFSFMQFLKNKIHFIMIVTLLLTFISFGTALYHMGIEYGLWDLPEYLCSVKEVDTDLLLDPNAQIKPIQPCKKPFMLFNTISLATINTGLSGFLFLFGGLTYLRYRKENKGK